MKKQKGTDYSKMLIWSAAIVTVVRYMAAFIASDIGEITGKLSEVITFFMGISGIGMGILDVFGGAYLFDGWRRAMPANDKRWSFRFKMLTVFVFALILSGIGILVPFTISRVTHESMAVVLKTESLTVWAILVNIAPYLLIGGVAVGSQIVMVNETNEQANGSPDGSPIVQSVPNGSRTYAKLTNTEKYYILNEKSEAIAGEWGVTPRAVQKWRKRVQEETKQGLL
jgi:hypothetical protein